MFMGLGLTMPNPTLYAPHGVGAGVDNILLEDGSSNLLLEDGSSVLLKE